MWVVVACCLCSILCHFVLCVNVQVLQSLHERIHPPDVIGKYAPDSVIGNVGSGVAAPVAGGAAKAGGAPARTGLC